MKHSNGTIQLVRKSSSIIRVLHFSQHFEKNDELEKATLRKYELLKLMTLYLQPDEETKWSKFSGYGCYCFQSYNNEFWKGQGLPKDDIDRYNDSFLLKEL